MNLNKSSAMVLAFMLACNPVLVFGAEPLKQNNQPTATPTVVPLNMQDSDRYTVARPYRFHSLVEFKQPIYVGPETIKGLVEKPVQETDLYKALIVNEATHVGVEVVVGSAARFLVDKEFGIPLYMVGCKDRDGKPFYNRITVLKKVESRPVAVETVPVATPQPKPVAQAKPAPKPVVKTALPYDETQEVRFKKPITNVVDKEAGYDVRFESGKGKIAVIPAIEVDETAVVVNIPKPTVRANGKKMSLGDGQ